jgi:uncharacterized protein YjbI with pentapeptide repeats
MYWFLMKDHGFEYLNLFRRSWLETMTKCKYKYQFVNPHEVNNFKCAEEVWQGSEYCILHINFPKDKNSPEFKALLKEKNKKIVEKINNNDFNFRGAKLPEINFKGMTITKDIVFSNALIEGSALFSNSTIEGYAVFESATIKGNVNFIGANIKGWAVFDGVNINGDTKFTGANISGSTYFMSAKLKGNLLFDNTTIGHDAYFNSAIIEAQAFFNGINIIDELSFKDTTFKEAIIQEIACRKSKQIYEGLGDKLNADYYFYREMDAKRKLKSNFNRYFEWIFIQIPFGYGVYPKRVIITWILIILVFTGIYSTEKLVFDLNALLSYFYSSVVTATTPGFGTYRPTGLYQLAASIEAIIGTFLWAAFIATFARKYMK